MKCQGRGRHTTLIDGLKPIIDIFKRYPEISVSPGRITTGLPAGRHRLKIKQLSGGVEVTFRGSCSKQVLHLYGDGQKIETILRQQTRIHVQRAKPKTS